MKLNLTSLSTEHADAIEESFSQQERRQRLANACSREGRRQRHLAKKNAAPSLGQLLAPGVPHDMRLVVHDDGRRVGA